MKSISSGVSQDKAPESAQILKESVSNSVFLQCFLEQDSSVNLIRGLDSFLDVVSSLDKSFHRSFQAVDFVLGKTS